LAGRCSPFRNRVVDLHSPLLGLKVSSADHDYLQQQAQICFEFIGERIAQLGLIGRERVLDVGCGFGQWTFALGVTNSEVVGFDPSPTRVEFAQQLAKSEGPNPGVRVLQARVEDAEFGDETFDAIFCFGVFMFLDSSIALDRFDRWLRPGGTLYICTNSHGWWVYLLLVKGWRSLAIARSTIRSLVRGCYGIPSAFTRQTLKRRLEESGFCDVEVDLEGRIGARTAKMNTYFTRFAGLPVCIEARATKRGIDRVASHQNPLSDVSLPRVDQDASIRLAVLDGVGRVVDKIEPERWFGERSDREVIDLIVALHQDIGSQIFHDTHHEYLKAGGRLPDSSHLNRLLGVGRCGVKARVLADELVKRGLRAGTLHTGSHVMSYMEWKDEIVVLDCDLYAPGRIPLTTGGLLPSLSDYIRCEGFLDRTLNSVYLMDRRNLQAGQSDLIPVASTIGNSKQGSIRKVERVDGEDRFRGEFRVPERPIEFVRFPPALKCDESGRVRVWTHSIEECIALTPAVVGTKMDDESIGNLELAEWSTLDVRSDELDLEVLRKSGLRYVAVVYRDHWQRNPHTLVPMNSIVNVIDGRTLFIRS
jgi:SAM-dependent methyltransferase